VGFSYLRLTRRKASRDFSPDTTCGVCGSTQSKGHLLVKEMMLGTRTPFTYSECNACGTVQLCDPPSTWYEYYPSDAYYSFKAHDRRRSVRGLVGRALAAPGTVGLCLTSLAYQFSLPICFYETLRLPFSARWFRGLGIKRTSSILDVGAGSGTLLHELAGFGFRQLTGIDPFVIPTTTYPDGVRLISGELHDVAGVFDLIMFNHSLEHMAQPRETLRLAIDRMKANGSILVRIPVADSWAFREYRQHWSQLDAPRHQYIYTTASMRLLAESEGLVVCEEYRDSHAFGLYASEQYRRDIPLTTPDVFSGREIHRFGRRARRLNREGLGDQATFVLKRHGK
jgi:SAM-dependent methyltransferase